MIDKVFFFIFFYSFSLLTGNKKFIKITDMIRNIKIGGINNTSVTPADTCSWKELKNAIEEIEKNGVNMLNSLNISETQEITYEIFCISGKITVMSQYDYKNHLYLEFDGRKWKADFGNYYYGGIKKWTTKREKMYKFLEDFLDHGVLPQ